MATFACPHPCAPPALGPGGCGRWTGVDQGVQGQGWLPSLAGGRQEAGEESCVVSGSRSVPGLGPRCRLVARRERGLL